MLQPELPRAAYLHVPFCVHRCGYCNFTVVAGRDELADRYLDALEQELAWLVHPRAVDTLFVGGTPTHLKPAQLGRLLAAAARWFPLSPGHEFSVEANPADLSTETVELLAEHGVTRLSLGAQSFDAAKLDLLERDHRAEDIARSVALARGQLLAVSLDLIFATPGEMLATWRADLAGALALAPDHVSTYGLTFERGTAFWTRKAKGQLHPPHEEQEREMYAVAIDTLKMAGFEHYEVSNFARPGRRCRHNEAYWAGEGYYAAGPGASRYVAGRRETNHRSTTTWIKRVLTGQSPVAESETLLPEDRAREAMVFGLRRLDGIDLSEFRERFGHQLDELGGNALRDYLALGLLDDRGGRLRLTREGLFVSDAIWPAFLRT